MDLEGQGRLGATVGVYSKESVIFGKSDKDESLGIMFPKEVINLRHRWKK